MVEEYTEVQDQTEDNNEGVQSVSSVSGIFANKAVTLGLAAVTFLILVAVGYKFYSNSQEEKQAKAALYLSRIRPVFESGNYQAAIQGFEDKVIRGEKVYGLKYIASEYSGTESGKLASLYLAQSLVGTGNYSEAEQYFENAAGASSTIVQAGGKAGLATVKDKNGDFVSAAKLYLEAAKLTVGSADEQYKYYAAFLYEKASNKEEAAKLYREIIASNESSEFAIEAKIGMSRLGLSL